LSQIQQSAREIRADLPQTRFASSPLLVLAGAISVGILGQHYATPEWKPSLSLTMAPGFGLTLLAIGLISKKKLTGASLALIAAFFFAGQVLGTLETRTVGPDRLSKMYDAGVITSGEPVELIGIVLGQPEPARDSFYLTLQVEKIRVKGQLSDAAGTVLLLAHGSADRVRAEFEALGLRHGARVQVMTTLDRDEGFRNPGVPPFTEYLERKGFDANGVIKSPLLIERLDDTTVFLPLAWVYEWREQLQREFDARFSPETAGVLAAALLGNRYNISRSAAERFRAGGTFHVLVISGLQIAFIGGLVFVITRHLVRRKLLQFFMAATFMWAYTMAVGAEASVARAALMFTLAVFAPVVSRRSNSLNVIGGAALALLVWRPQTLFDPSFQLTFLSVLAIVLLAVPVLQKMQRVGSWRPARETPYPPECPRWFRVTSEALFWSERAWRAELSASNINYRLFKTPVAAGLERWRMQRIFRFAMAAVIVSVSVQIGLLPLTVIYFHRLSIAALALNIFVGVLMAALAFVALAGLLIARLGLWLATPLFMLAEKVNWTMIHLVDPFSSLGIASIRLPHYSGWAGGLNVLYYLLLAFIVFAAVSWDPLRPVWVDRPTTRSFASRHIRVLAILFGIVLGAIVFHPLSAAKPDGHLHVDFLDVGQGDAALLTMPDGTTLLVDGGGRPNFNRSESNDGDEAFERDTRTIGEGVVSQYLWSRGLDRIDYILATHADADHIAGLSDVANNFKTRGAIVARIPSDDQEYQHFAATMKQAGVPISVIGGGDVLHFGAVSAQVLWPPPFADQSAASRNNDSIVLLVRYGNKSLLLTGDLEKQGEAAVLREGISLNTDVVKVAHHGSKSGSIEALVSATSPSLAIISVGRTSMFGHPNQDVVARWRAIGAQVMTTGQRGTISVVTDGKTLTVSTFVRQ
jgi:competence protein ComEC